jgi:hypothetical protein
MEVQRFILRMKGIGAGLIPSGEWSKIKREKCSEADGD